MGSSSTTWHDAQPLAVTLDETKDAELDPRRVRAWLGGQDVPRTWAHEELELTAPLPWALPAILGLHARGGGLPRVFRVSGEREQIFVLSWHQGGAGWLELRAAGGVVELGVRRLTRLRFSWVVGRPKPLWAEEARWLCELDLRRESMGPSLSLHGSELPSAVRRAWRGLPDPSIVTCVQPATLPGGYLLSWAVPHERSSRVMIFDELGKLASGVRPWSDFEWMPSLLPH